MKINLTDAERKSLDEILTQKDENYDVSQLINSFLEDHYDAIGESAVRQIMKEDGTTVEESMIEAFHRYLSLDRQDPQVEKMKEDTDFGNLAHIKEEEFLNHPFNKIKVEPVCYGSYQLRYNYFEPFEIFNCDETKTDEKNNYAEKTTLGYFEKKVPYLMLTQKDEIWMSITPHEINTMRNDIKEAKGRVLTLGLGLGYYAFEVSNKKEVSEVIIIEKDRNVITLFEKNILPHFPHKEKIHIIRQDAFLYFERELRSEHFDTIFVDIYHTPDDALPLYLRFRKGEDKIKGQKVDYWIEESILAYLRRFVLTIIEEYYQGYTKDDYMVAEDEQSEILKKIYMYLSKKEFNSLNDIHQILSNDGLRELSQHIN
jgi:hypothetical protein